MELTFWQGYLLCGLAFSFGISPILFRMQHGEWQWTHGHRKYLEDNDTGLDFYPLAAVLIHALGVIAWPALLVMKCKRLLKQLFQS